MKNTNLLFFDFRSHKSLQTSICQPKTLSIIAAISLTSSFLFSVLTAISDRSYHELTLISFDNTETCLLRQPSRLPFAN